MNISGTQTGLNPYQYNSSNPSLSEGKFAEKEGIVTTSSDKEKEGGTKAKNKADLSQGERQQVSQLRQRDSEVRAHEAAHIAAGGSVISGSASFTYQKGPDGKLYAIGGEVPISSPGGSTPEEKISIARQIQAGALAPANPSPQDYKVATSAAMMEAQARQELRQEKNEELKQKAASNYSATNAKDENGSKLNLYS